MLKEQSVFDKWLEKMDSQRREKVLRCKDEGDKRRSLLAGILLRFALENVGAEKKVFYSISHSGDYVICVVSNRRVGIDIEDKNRSLMKRIDKLNKVAKRCFTMGEEIRFQTAEDDEKMEFFLKCWTRKESYSKAVGKGLAMDFSTIDTEKMDLLYWSDWLEEGYFCSLYVENGLFSDMKLQQMINL
jgi:4'-phosphopantetheinyl transferase